MERQFERRLTKNAIESFIIRFDLVLGNSIDFNKLLADISRFFDRTEKRRQTNFQVNFTSDKSEVNRLESFDYVLIKERERYSMTFSESQNAFWFETTNYVNNETYAGIIAELLISAQKNAVNISTRRIGMRFINNFNCSSSKRIAQIFNTEISKTLVQRLNQENISRVICQDEFNFDGNKVRVQFGIPNKFYPAIINNFDLLLDIDSFDDSMQEIVTIKETIGQLNHFAYKAFVSCVNSKYIDTLK
jgi:uncharacterized protein (TIGR04255 family)